MKSQRARPQAVLALLSLRYGFIGAGVADFVGGG